MSPTVKRNLCGLLALAAALVVAGAGCTAPDDGDIASVEQELAPVDSEGTPDLEDEEEALEEADPGGPTAPGTKKLTTVSGPEPIPWMPPIPPPEDECAAPSNPSPMTHGSSGSSNGSGSK